MTYKQDDIPPIVVSGDILMLGRSVMAGWFIHWGASGETGDIIKKEGFTLKYGHMDTPPNIVNSARSLIERFKVDRKWIVFFKFCFEDFATGSNEEVIEVNKRNKAYQALDAKFFPFLKNISLQRRDSNILKRILQKRSS